MADRDWTPNSTAALSSAGKLSSSQRSVSNRHPWLLKGILATKNYHLIELKRLKVTDGENIHMYLSKNEESTFFFSVADLLCIFSSGRECY